MTKTAQLLQAVGLPVVLGVIAYFALLAGPLEEFEQSRSRQHRMLDEYAYTVRASVNLGQERERLKALDDMLGVLMAILPTAEGREIPREGVTQMLQGVSGKFGVRLASVEFADTRAMDFYASRSVSFKVQGTFAGTTNFLHELAGTPASVRRITALEMRPERGGGVTAQVRLEEYAYLDDGTVARLRAEQRRK